MNTTWLLSFCFLVNLSLLKAEKVSFKQDVRVGKSKFKCSFTIIYGGTVVNLRKSKAKCSPAKKKAKAENLELTAPSGIHFLVDMTFNPTKIVKATIVNIKTTTTPTTSETPSNCGPRQCGIWCSDKESCYESENTNCVQAPCCVRWQCRVSTTPRPPTPTSAPTPPTVPPTSTCCKERIFKRSVYVLVGVEVTLPVCGNDCIYKKKIGEIDDQLFCFPTSFSELANQCDSVAIPPQLLLGLSPWSAWTACQGDCELESAGRSSRSRSCVADISDELSCVGPTTQLRNCELNCRQEQAKQQQLCNPSTFPSNVLAQGYPCKYHFLPAERWTDAQETCKQNFGGKLWEPANSAEYDAVINAAESQANYLLLNNCRWWLGLFNWNDGSPNSIDAYLSSTVIALPTVAPNHNEPTNGPNGVISNFITVLDGNDGGNENCVHTWYSGWMDSTCSRKLPFICQECPPPCSCSFNGVSYPCGSIIKKNPHCCSDLICHRNGTIVDQQILGSNGKPIAGCCIWRGRMFRDGDEFGPFWARKVCCRGEILSKYGKFIQFPLPQNVVHAELHINENGENFTQTSSFNSENNILKVSVPPHSSYNQTSFLLDGNVGQTILNSNGTCLMSNNQQLDVSEMANQMGTNTEQFSKSHVLQIRSARVGYKERMQLTKTTRDFCSKEGIIKTKVKPVGEDQYQDLIKGNVIFLNNDSIISDQCWLEEACTNPGPNACGYGWPNPTGGGFSAHQLSATVICVDCCVEASPGCCRKNHPMNCICKEISNKIDLMDCILGNETHEITYQDPSGTSVTQRMKFNAKNPEGNPRALKFEVPSHDNFMGITMLMHANEAGYWHHPMLKNNMLMKFGRMCHILDLPADIFPMDLGISFLESGDFTLTSEDQTIATKSLVQIGPVESFGSLHKDIKKLCAGFTTIKSELVEANTTYTEISTFKLNEAKMDPGQQLKQSSSCCSQQVVSTITGACIVWPNPVTGVSIGVHVVVTDQAETELTCCVESATPGCSPTFPSCCQCHCACADITTADKFRECLTRPLVLRNRITEDTIARLLDTNPSNDDLTPLHASNLISALRNLKTANGGSLGYVARYHGDWRLSPTDPNPGPCGTSYCCPHGTSTDGDPNSQFLPWHRLYTVQFDTELRTQSTGVHHGAPDQDFVPATLPYWDWTSNHDGTGPMSALPDLVANPTIVDPMNPTDPPVTNPFYEANIPPINSLTTRSVFGFLFTYDFLQDVIDSLAEPTFVEFSNQLTNPHNWIHGGIGGSMGSTAHASYDPVFYLNHNMVDLVWAVYQFINVDVPAADPLFAALTLQQHPFDYPAENQQDITSMNYEVGETLNYEADLCYTYSLTGNPFKRSLDINSPSIVFGGKNLSQISEDVRRVKLTDHHYAGLFIRSLGMSYTVSINICQYFGSQQLKCFPGGAIFVFGGEEEKPYNNTVVTKIDVTKKLTNNFMSADDTENIKFEIVSVLTPAGKELDKSLVFQPVSVLRSVRAKADLLTLYLGPNLRNKYAPKINVLHGTRMKLIYQPKIGDGGFGKEKIKFYQTENQLDLETCYTRFAEEIGSPAADSLTVEFVVDWQWFPWYFAKGEESCYPLETEIGMYEYSDCPECQ